jgi:hypothetical protein
MQISTGYLQFGQSAGIGKILSLLKIQKDPIIGVVPCSLPSCKRLLTVTTKNCRVHPVIIRHLEPFLIPIDRIFRIREGA